MLIRRVGGRVAKKNKLTRLQRRLKFVHDTYPPEVFIPVAEAVLYRGHGREGSPYLSPITGAWGLARDLSTLDEREGTPDRNLGPKDAAAHILGQILKGRHWSWDEGVSLPEAIGLEAIIPWVAQQVNVLRKNPPKRPARVNYWTEENRRKMSARVPVRHTKKGRKSEPPVSIDGVPIPLGINVEVISADRGWGADQQALIRLPDGRELTVLSVYLDLGHYTDKEMDTNVAAYKLLGKLSEIRDWAEVVEPDLMTLRATQALARQARWHAQMARETKGLLPGGTAGDDGTKKVLDLEDGWSLVEIVENNALVVEGRVMGHCIGSVPSYWRDRVDGHHKIYSLRDAEGRSRASMTVDNPDDKRPWQITQVKGPGDRPVGVRMDVARKAIRAHENAGLKRADAGYKHAHELLEAAVERGRSRMIAWDEILRMDEVMRRQDWTISSRFDGLGLLMYRDMVRRRIDWRPWGQG